MNSRLKSVSAIVNNGPNRRVIARDGFGGPNVADLGDDTPEAAKLGALFAAAPEAVETLANVLAWYQKLKEPGLVPNGTELGIILRDASKLVARVDGRIL